MAVEEAATKLAGRVTVKVTIASDITACAKQAYAALHGLAPSQWKHDIRTLQNLYS